MYLCACSGGGGSDPATSAPISEPPPSTPTTEQFEITPENIELLAFDVGATLKVTALVATAATNKFVELIDSGSFEHRINCDVSDPSAGQSIISLEDTDGSGDLTGGDTVTVTYVGDCRDPDLEEVVKGTIQIAMENFVISEEGAYELRALMSIESGFELSSFNSDRLAFAGNLELVVGHTNGTKRTIVRQPAGNTFQYERQVATQPGETFTVSLENFEYQESSRAASSVDAKETAFQFDMDSTRLGGRVSCGTPTPMRSSLYTAPFGEFIDCLGDGIARSRFTWQETDLEIISLFYLDSDDSGNFSLVAQTLAVRADLLTVFIKQSVRPNGRTSRSQWQDLASTTANFAIVDSAIDAQRNRLYLLTGSELIAVNSETLTELDRTALEEEASSIAVSDDGTTLYLADRDAPRIRRFDGPALNPIDDFTYSSPARTVGTDDFTPQLLVAPGSVDLVVAAARFRGELVAFNDGAELPESVEVLSAAGRIMAWTSDGRIATTLRHASESQSLGMIVIDSLTGLRVEDEYPGYPDWDGSIVRMFESDNQIYTSKARLINLDRGTVSARLESLSPSTPSPIMFAGHIGRNRIYGLHGGGARLSVYRREPLTLIAGYTFDDFRIDGQQNLHITNEHLLLTYNDRVVQIELDGLVANVRNEWCEQIDLSIGIQDTFLLHECYATSAAYDALNNQIWVGIAAYEGEKGNAIAVYNPETGERVALIPVGSRVGRMKVASDQQAMLVSLPDANELAVIDLSSFQPGSFQPLGFDQDAMRSSIQPSLPTDVAPVLGSANDFVVTLLNGDVAFYRGNSRTANSWTAVSPTASPRAYENVFVSQNGTRVLAIHNRQSDFLSLSTAGIEHLTDLGDLFLGAASQPNTLHQIGDEVLSYTGDVFNLSSGTVSRACDLEFEQGESVIAFSQQDSNIIHYLTGVGINGGQLMIRSCDRSSSQIVTSYPPGMPISPRDMIGAFATAGGRLALVDANTIAFIDAPR